MYPISLRSLTLALSCLAALPYIVYGASSEQGAAPPSSNIPVAVPTSCSIDASWLNPPAPPTEIPGQGSLCNFDQFAWQWLFYLVQPTARDSRVLRFESWMPAYGIFVAAGEQPTPFGQHPPDPCNTPQAYVGKATGEAPFVFSNLIKQAGVDQPLLAPDGQFVWYNLAVNQPAYDMIVACDLYRSNCAGPLKPANHGIDLVAEYPRLAFPDGAVELKSSWKVLSEDEMNSSLFYTVSGWIQAPEQSGSCRSVPLGLVGLHIVAKTPSTAAFVWASFEHRNNAPLCSNLAATPPLGGHWNFFDPSSCDDCSTNTYEPGKPTRVCRMHPQGDSTLGSFPDGQDCEEVPNQFICQKGTRTMLAESTAAMTAINASAQQQIAQPGGAIDPVWANYELVGNLWTRDNVTPPQLQAQLGSLSAANRTMETFVQNGAAGQTAANNCFSCHNQSAAEFGTNLPPVGLSHIFDKLKAPSGGCGDGRLPASCAAYFGNGGSVTHAKETGR